MNNKRDGCQIKYFSLFCRPVKLSDFHTYFKTLLKNTNLLLFQAYQVNMFIITLFCLMYTATNKFEPNKCTHGNATYIFPVKQSKSYPTQSMKYRIRVRVMVLNATFNNISVISSWSVLLVEETGLPGNNHRQT
jgi:hypothetical protein